MAKPVYDDFDLQIWRDGDRYMAEVKASPAGGTQRVPLTWPFGPDSSDYLRLKLENAVLKGRGYRSAGPMTSDEAMLHEFGSNVFRAVFGDTRAIAECFTSSLEAVRNDAGKAGLRIKLRLDAPELAALPWEYMFDEAQTNPNPLQNYLCLRFRSPLVRFLDVKGSDAPLRVNGRLRVLGMIANPATDAWAALDTESERHNIENALKEANADIYFQWVAGGTPDALYRAVQRDSWHVFHFIGHGGTDYYMNGKGEQRAEGYVVMQDGMGGAVKVSASQLALSLEGGGGLRLAVLNCCESGSGSLSSAGAALVHSGVPMAVSMQFPITNGSASRFAGMFYESLIKGEPVEKALTSARQFMRMKSNLEWAIPVLFTRSGSCVLFEVDPRAEPASAQAAPPGSAAVPEFGRPSEPPAPPVTGARAQARDELRRLFKQRH